jgi:CRISPR/Cas system CSM-associated protein Csm3 (group 7 of RAMP superfamily)
MNEKIKIKINEKEKEFEIKNKGKMKVLELPIVIEVSGGSFLHIGAAPSPLTEKKGAVFKVDRIPVIPASSFKGALRQQLELLFIEDIENKNEFTKLFNISQQNKGVLKPCIPSPRPTEAEKELIHIGKYREKHCEVRVDEGDVKIDEINGICPACYFMGNAGLMGFLRFSNFYPEGEGGIIDQTNIRIDRKTGTAAHGAKVEGEQVKPGMVFRGNIDIVISEPVLAMQNLQFGDARVIAGKVLDKWLKEWGETDKNRRMKVLIENILISAIQNIKLLGGQKSRGAGIVNVEVELKGP